MDKARAVSAVTKVDRAAGEVMSVGAMLVGVRERGGNNGVFEVDLSRVRVIGPESETKIFGAGFPAGLAGFEDSFAGGFTAEL